MQNLNTQAQLLTELFLTKVKRITRNEFGKFPSSASYKKQVMEDAYNCLSSNFTYEQLEELINQAVESDATCYNISEYLKTKDSADKETIIKKQVIDPNNCVKIGEFYYHPVLQSTSRPPRFIMNPRTMEMEKTPQEPFFLEMKDSFTVEELTDYFIRQTGADETYPKRYFTQLKNLVGIYGIDLVLYLIDASVAKSKDEQEPMPVVPSFMQNNIEHAKNMHETRKEIAQEGGLTHVYPKRRSEASTE